MLVGPVPIQIVRTIESCYLSRMKSKRALSNREYFRGLEILAAKPSNQSGADKTWVLHYLRRLEHLFHSARLVPRKQDGSVR